MHGAHPCSDTPNATITPRSDCLEVRCALGQFGHELTNRGLAVAVGKRIRWMPHRGENFGVVEALPYVDDLGRHGWFFYGWSRVP